MKIIFFGVRVSEQELLARAAKHDLSAHTVELNSTCLDEQYADHSDAEVISVFVKCRITKPVLDRFPKLKLIVLRSTGYDNVDLDECKKRAITVSNVPSYGEHTVAEFTMALILALSRKLCAAINRVRTTAHFSTDELTGFDLKGKTLGVIGTGRIGQHVIRMAQGFGMNVVAYDAFPRSDLAQEMNITYSTLDGVLTASDIISLHIPYTTETHHLINTRTLGQMKQGSYIINTSRGGLIDTGALLASLNAGTLAGAALDVLEGETGTIPEELLADHRILITPHNAFNTKEAIGRIIGTTCENILSFDKGSTVNKVA